MTTDDREPAAGRAKPKPTRKPKPVSAGSLRASALWHLARFATTEARLRQALMRRVRRSVRDHGTDSAEAAGWIDTLTADLRDQGLLNDAEWARSRTRRLHARGVASARIVDRLRAAGIAGETARAAVAALGGDGVDAETAAAEAFARRRRLGPYRRTERPKDDAAATLLRQRELAALARAGFSYAVASAVLDGEVADDD